MDPIDLDEIFEFTKTLALEAGEIILKGSETIALPSSHAINEKKSRIDMVTEWDVKVEKHIKSAIDARYPKFDFLGEESYDASKRNSLVDRPTFCVDPIG